MNWLELIDFGGENRGKGEKEDNVFELFMTSGLGTPAQLWWQGFWFGDEHNKRN